MSKEEQPVQPANHTPDQQALERALQHHSAGRLAEAESIYQQVLQSDPNQPVALHLLGVIAHQVGKNDVAVNLISQALAFTPEFAEAHSNLGLALKELGRLDEAIASFRRAIEIKPGYAEAYSNLGNTLKEQGKPGEAVASYRRAIEIQPNYAEAHSNLGLTLQDSGKLDEAIASYNKAVTIRPELAEAHYNLANAHKELGRLDEAIANYHKALAINPDFAEAHSNLGNALKEQGRLDETFACHRRAVALKPQNDQFWGGLAVSLETLTFNSVDDGLMADLVRLLERPTVRPSYITRPIISALRQHPDFSRILEMANSGGPKTGITAGDTIEALAAIPLFLRILSLSAINDLEIEQLLTVLRRQLIEEAATGKTDEKGLAFSTALALQCFTNEYVFSETEDETKAAETLQKHIADLIDKGLDVPPSLVATLGAYRPLYKSPWARELSEREWTDDFRQVIERQISEPLEELALREQIPHLTPIQNTVSQSVREQYEENPYPRWVKIGIGNYGKDIRTALQTAPPRLELGEYQSPENPEILVAGCGTGQNALNTALRFSNARVLAVDLSLSSLSYAMRKTKELKLSNIEYAQADIMELGSFERRFDLIECSGVLHHLGDPLAGWRILVDLLRHGGLIKIALYSECARQQLTMGRSLIAAQGYTTSAEDIRRCRQDIIARAEKTNPEMAKICAIKDFFSLSECRDLLFHVQEQRFTLPQIQEALQVLNLKFLGFEMRAQRALSMFRETHPDKRALTSLSLWHEFENKNPDTFRDMYQFWCKKI